MIWVIIFLIIVASSTLLSVWRYVALTTRVEDLKAPTSLFVVQNKSILTSVLLEGILSELPQNTTMSLEMLKRGQDQALVVAIPRWIISNHPEIKILEIEDYLPTLPTTNQTVFCLQFADPKLKVLSLNFLQDIFSSLQLNSRESLFVQLIIRPVTRTAPELDANIRVIISSAGPGRSQQIKQQFLELLNQKSSLIRNPLDQNAAEILSHFRARTYAKHEFIFMHLSPTEVTYFLA